MPGTAVPGIDRPGLSYMVLGGASGLLTWGRSGTIRPGRGPESRRHAWAPDRPSHRCVLGGPMVAVADVKAIRLGHPSYVWRSGQDRRLNQIRRYVALENRRINRKSVV